MKIISYNISESKPWKIERLLGMGADVLIVPEITCPDEAHLPEEYDMMWNGLEYTTNEKKWKGLGMIWKKGEGRIPQWYNPNLHYAIPLVIDNYLILGIWPTKLSGEKKSYPQIAQEIILEYAPFYDKYNTLIIGDFNCYVDQSDATKEYGDMLRVNEILNARRFHSLYHLATGDEFGKEHQPTYYHQFQKDRPFFLDYAYTKTWVDAFRLLPWDKEMSDHVGMTIEIEKSENLVTLLKM